jgi:hypothetical protein
MIAVITSSSTFDHLPVGVSDPDATDLDRFAALTASCSAVASQRRRSK